MTALLVPNSPAWIAACNAATKIIVDAARAAGLSPPARFGVRHLGEYTHGPVAIGLVIDHGPLGIEVPVRRKEEKYGVTGGYLRLEHLLQALLREWGEEEFAEGTKPPFTIEDIISWSRFVGIIDVIGHTVANQANLRELVVILLVTLPEGLDLKFTPSGETSEKAILTCKEIMAQPQMFRGDGEHPMILRAAACAERGLPLPDVTTDPFEEGVYLNIVTITDDQAT